MNKEHPFRAIRRAGVPLVVWETSDPAMTIKSCVTAVGKNQPVMQWDLVNALGGVNAEGKSLAGSIASDKMMTLNPTECLDMVGRYVRDNEVATILFMHNVDRLISNEAVAQAVWNLRDQFKGAGSTLVMLCPSMTVPAALKHDCVVITEPLPNEAAIRDIVASIGKDAGVTIEDKDFIKIIDTLLGLSAFAAEQVLAMSISKSGVDLDSLWERKRKMIEQTPGLSVWRGGDKFDDIGGCENVKKFTKKILNGRAAPRAICFIDEIEKALAGASSDTSGVTQDYLGTLLAWMEDKDATGMIFIGPPGAAKSAVAKAAGNEGNIPTIKMDFGGMKGSLVGESERQLRGALQVIEAVSQGKTLFIATCNSISVLPPELRRRFKLGTFFFDLPDMLERELIWKIYMKKYDREVYINELPNNSGWTGAEIKQCCETAWRLECSLSEAARFVVPVSKSAPEAVLKLRKEANDKFVSAAVPGMYQHVELADLDKVKSRKFEQD